MKKFNAISMMNIRLTNANTISALSYCLPESKSGNQPVFGDHRFLLQPCAYLDKDRS